VGTPTPSGCQDRRDLSKSLLGRHLLGVISEAHAASQVLRTESTLSVPLSTPYLPEGFSNCRVGVAIRQAGNKNGVVARCLRNTHNAFRFAAGSMSGDIAARGAFTAMG
jgi:hypothetical protein